MAINAANSTVGQLLVQLCRVLQLRCIGLVRRHANFDQTCKLLQVCHAPGCLLGGCRLICTSDWQPRVKLAWT